MQSYAENLQKYWFLCVVAILVWPVLHAQIDESVMLNRLLPDGQIIHVSLKFWRSGRMQDVQPCWQQFCSFINRTCWGITAWKIYRKHFLSREKIESVIIFGITILKLKPYGKEHNVIKKPFLLAFSLTSCNLLWDLVSCLPMSFFFYIKWEHNEHTTSVHWFIFHTSSNKTSCENSCRCNPYHWSCKAKPKLPARWVFDVSAVSSRCWNASPPACGAEESPALLKPTYNRLSTLVMLSLLPLQLFVFRSLWITVFLSALAQTHTQTISMWASIPIYALYVSMYVCIVNNIVLFCFFYKRASVWHFKWMIEGYQRMCAYGKSGVICCNESCRHGCLERYRINVNF